MYRCSSETLLLGDRRGIKLEQQPVHPRNVVGRIFDLATFRKQRVIEQDIRQGAEALIVTWAGGGFIPMMNSAVELGVLEDTALAASFIDNVAQPAFFADAIGATSGILYHYTLPDNEINDWLVERHIEEYGAPPDLWAAGGMMAAQMLVEGLEANFNLLALNPSASDGYRESSQVTGALTLHARFEL